MKKNKKIQEIENQLISLSREDKKIFFQNYFKFYDFPNRNPTVKPDLFLGVIVPDIRKIAKKYFKLLDFNDIDFFIKSRYHEYRFFSLVVLLYQFQKSKKENDYENLKRIKEYYLNHIDFINNWDLVDNFAPKILGEYLLIFPKEKPIIYELAYSNHLWKERTAILITFAFIKKKQFSEFFQLVDYFLEKENHFLIQKAIGWGLREIGKKEKSVLIQFLKINYGKIPSITWNYATERLNKKELKINQKFKVKS